MVTNAINVVKTLLTDNYTKANVDNIQFTIDLITEKVEYDLRKRKNSGTGGDGDTILIYQASGNPAGFGFDAMQYSPRVTIQAQSMWSSGAVTWQAHAQKMHDEIIRIIEGNKNNPATGWLHIIPVAEMDLDDKMRKQAKRVIDVQLKRSGAVTAI